MGLKHYKIQLASLNTGKNITDTGGMVYVATANSPSKATLYTAAGGAQSNPIAPVNGMIEFYTADTVSAVDLYAMSPTGHAFIRKGVVASGENEIWLDTFTRRTELVVPFSIADTTTGTETDTGFDLPTNSIVDPMTLAVDVSTLESGKTIDVGILSSESGGDADGFMDGLSLTTAVTVFPAIGATTGVLDANTFGILVTDYTAGTNSDDRGMVFLERYRCNGTAKSVSYTLAATVSLAKGFIRIGYTLANI